ncbi:protein kinase family protein [Streptococcus sp. 121]|uniref:protein kinase family protein n=1 Tax=Streptococcus sp. 121 TaxID=2797637 RepID=UPI0018F0DA31|nr:protein kinase family protein [Streptococcus sp. 121]MBJ6745128.1 protein kinase family protein [Streptococcus sp. 121]
MFTYYDSSKYLLPEFGFKIHISGTWENYREIYRRTIPFLIDRDISFKYIKDKEDVLFNLSTEESPSESGKLITIYPENRNHCIEILNELYDLLPSNIEGVYILSDRNYYDSNILFYRYGCIKVDKDKLINGLPTLICSDGKIWQDFQRTYFELPNWIEDLQEKQVFKPSYLGNTYEIENLIKQSNGGNVYKAKRMDNGKNVVIKESRPYIHVFEEIQKKMLKENEWNILENFRSSVRKIEKVKEWLNYYYIYEYIDGEDIVTFCDNLNLFSYFSSNVDKNLNHCKQLLTIFTKIIQTVYHFHKQGVILHDIHPSNFIVDNHKEVHFIDFENSYIDGTKPHTGIYSDVSLKNWNRLNGKIADCYKVGNTLLYLLGRLQLTDERDRLPEVNNLLLQKKYIRTLMN